MAVAKSKETPLKRKYRIYRALKQYKDLPDDRIMVMAKDAVAKDESVIAALPVDPLMDVELAAKFNSKTEQSAAHTLWLRYLKDYSLESPSDHGTLREIVYLEVLQTRLQRKLNQFEDDDAKFVPFDLMDAMHKNADVLVKLKASLGLNKSKDKLAGYDAHQHLLKRHKLWRSENQASRYMKCAHCQHPNLLMMRTAAWESYKHPYFRDGIIYNQHLFANLGRTTVIDSTFISKVLGTSPDYIDWVVEKSRQGITPTAAEVAAYVGDTHGGSTQTSGQGESPVTQDKVTISAPG